MIQKQTMSRNSMGMLINHEEYKSNIMDVSRKEGCLASMEDVFENVYALLLDLYVVLLVVGQLFAASCTQFHVTREEGRGRRRGR